MCPPRQGQISTAETWFWLSPSLETEVSSQMRCHMCPAMASQASLRARGTRRTSAPALRGLGLPDAGFIAINPGPEVRAEPAWEPARTELGNACTCLGFPGGWEGGSPLGALALPPPGLSPFMPIKKKYLQQ